MEKSPKKLIIKKIPLASFLELLNNLYAGGADYIDLEGISDSINNQDTIGVNVPLSYRNEEYKDDDVSVHDEPVAEKEIVMDNKKMTKEYLEILVKNV